MSACPACVAGTFGNISGLSNCHDCVAGRVSSVNATVCQDCIPGTIASQPRMMSCQLCQVGDYVDIFSGTVCTTCPVGLSTQGQGAGSDQRPAAVPEYFNSLDACVPYCRAGKFSMWGVQPLGSSECTNCPAGYYNSENASTLCMPCVGGTYSNAGSTVCSKCAAGKYAGPVQSGCQECAAGTYSHMEGLSECALCALDTYAEARGSTVCSVCPSEVVHNVKNTFFIKDCRYLCNNSRCVYILPLPLPLPVNVLWCVCARVCVGVCLSVYVYVYVCVCVCALV